jgi:predicted enzyme related to lactoylglutathione lyase
MTRAWIRRIVLVNTVLLGCAQAPTAANTSNDTTIRERAEHMKASHIHLGVKDLPAALNWLETVWQITPTYRDERLASVPVGEFTVILDASPSDVAATIGFDSKNCDEDFRAVVARGGVALEEPKDRPWGVRAAYVQGPGALKFEIEQMLPRPK